MACSVSIQEVLGFVFQGNTVPHEIRVSGIATDCSTVEITIECGGIPLPSETATVNAAGKWTKTFTNVDKCECLSDAKLIKVVVKCVDDPNCPPDTVGPRRLRCKRIQQPCESTGELTVSVEGCIGGGGGDVTSAVATLTFNVTPPIAGCTYKWDLDVSDPTSPIITTTVPELITNFTTPGMKTVSVRAECPLPGGGICILEDTITFPVNNCDGDECPKVIVPLPIPVDGCAEPGVATVNLVGTLTPPIAGCTFLWAWEDNGTSFSMTTSVPSISINFTKSGSHTVSVTAICPGITPCHTELYDVDIPICCPIVIDITPFQDENNACTWNFLANMIPSPPEPAPVGTYQWDFGDGATTSTSGPLSPDHSYTSSGTKDVQVTYIPDPMKYPDCVQSSLLKPGLVNVPASCGNGDGGNGDGGFGFCSGLLVAAIGLIVAGAIALVLGVCLHIPWLAIAGGIAGFVGLVLFVLWAFFCAAFTSCSVMRTMYCILWWIVAVVGPIVTALALAIGDSVCQLTVAGAWGGLGSILAWLGSIMSGLDCSPSTCLP
jgi:hypothetical protein